jgi:hypothetical protein
MRRYKDDYSPGRVYRFVQFTDGTGKTWWKIEYPWGLWTLFVRYWSDTEYGMTPSEADFDTKEDAVDYLEAVKRRYEFRQMQDEVTAVADETWTG